MGALEQVTYMKAQGTPEQEIINRLQEQGISQREINDALHHSRIKEAVSNPVIGEGMESSIMDNQTERIKTDGYSPKTKEIGPSKTDGFYTPQPQSETESYNYEQNYYPGAQEPPQEYAPQENLQEYYSAGSGGSDTDTLIEISEQVFSEKIRKIHKQVDELESFKEIAWTKINHVEERLRRIETSLDRLQSAILEKVGSYGAGLESIKKEMSMMQDSFSKTLPALAEHHTHHTEHSQEHHKKNSKK